MSLQQAVTLFESVSRAFGVGEAETQILDFGDGHYAFVIEDYDAFLSYCANSDMFGLMFRDEDENDDLDDTPWFEGADYSDAVAALLTMLFNEDLVALMDGVEA